MAIWDYEGKLEAKGWDADLLRQVIDTRFMAPPGKLLRAIAYPAFEFLLEKFYQPPAVEPGRLEGAVGKTQHVAYSPLELKEDAGRAATTADHAAVDLSVWAPPGETREQALAREQIRKLAVSWWAFCVQQDSEDWLWA